MHEFELYHGQSKKNVVEARALKEIELQPEHASRSLDLGCQDYDQIANLNPDKVKPAP